MVLNIVIWGIRMDIVDDARSKQIEGNCWNGERDCVNMETPGYYSNNGLWNNLVHSTYYHSTSKKLCLYPPKTKISIKY